MSRQAPPQTDTTREPTKDDSLQFLVEQGLPVETVFDVGVHRATPELMRRFPEKKHVLFEPVPDHNDVIERNYQGRQIDFDLFNVALSDTDGSAHQQRARNASGVVAHSKILEEPGDDSVPVSKKRLDTFFREMSYPAPFLLKLDVDGHEIPIIEGAQELLQHCSCAVVEAQVLRIPQTLEAMTRNNMVLFDITDLCYTYGALWQVDLIFLTPSLQKHFCRRPNEARWNAYAKWEKYKQ